MEALPYFQRRLFVSKLIKSIPPRFLYKYKSLSGEGDSHIRDILIHSKLWLSSPSDFNDPFDLEFKINIKGNRRDIEKKYKEIEKKFSSKMQYKEFDRVKIQKNLNKSQKEYINKMGVFSLSKDPRNILMWGHYADKHRGIAIQFETVRTCEIFTHTLPMVYISDYPSIEWPKNYENELRRVISHKYVGWKDEKEWRIMRKNLADHYLDISPDSVTGIVLGCEMKKCSINVIKDMLSKREENGLPAIKLYQAKKHVNKYQLILSKVKS